MAAGCHSNRCSADANYDLILSYWTSDQLKLLTLFSNCNNTQGPRGTTSSFRGPGGSPNCRQRLGLLAGGVILHVCLCPFDWLGRLAQVGEQCTHLGDQPRIEDVDRVPSLF